MDPRALRLLTFDGLAGATVGVGVIALHPWLAGLYALPSDLVLGLGVVNLAYGSYSGTLALRARRGVVPSRRAIDVLVVANVAWGFVCAGLLATVASGASAIGIATLAGEGLFVAGLGLVEARVLRPHAR